MRDKQTIAKPNVLKYIRREVVRNCKKERNRNNYNKNSLEKSLVHFTGLLNIKKNKAHGGVELNIEDRTS